MPRPVTIKRDYMGRPCSIAIEWDIQDAIEIAYVLQSAGLDHKTWKVRDHGFYDDGTALFEAACKAEDELKGRDDDG